MSYLEIFKLTKKMKQFTLYAILIILIGFIIYTNKKTLYGFGKQTLNSEKLIVTDIQNDAQKYIWGIDISHHQKKIDWNVLEEQNKPDFIFLKCTEGRTHHDSKYQIYKNEAFKRGILIGGYHFFSYHSNGKDQAENFLKHADLKKGDLFPVLDIEYKKIRPSNEEIRKEVRKFCKVIKEKLGVNPIIYCEADYYKDVLKGEFDDYNYWISDLFREPDIDYVFWQYTDKGEVKGIGKIDNNRLRKGLKIENYILK